RPAADRPDRPPGPASRWDPPRGRSLSLRGAPPAPPRSASPTTSLPPPHPGPRRKIRAKGTRGCGSNLRSLFAPSCVASAAGASADGLFRVLVEQVHLLQVDGHAVGMPVAGPAGGVHPGDNGRAAHVQVHV